MLSISSHRSFQSLALRKAREALAKYHRLRVRVEHDRLKVRFLEGQLRERDKRMAGEKDTTKAVEASLLAEVSNLQTYEFLFFIWSSFNKLCPNYRKVR